MRILLAGYADTPLIPWLIERGHAVDNTQGPITADHVAAYDWIVCYGLRHIVPPDLCAAKDGRMINLHAAFLPWNRGADPNLWSWIDDTPKGVSIHHVSAGLDRGDLIARVHVEMGDSETLRSSYAKLRNSMDDLFRAMWPTIAERPDALIELRHLARMPQPEGGSYHCLADRARVERLLTDDHDTPVSALRAQALQAQGQKRHAG